MQAEARPTHMAKTVCREPTHMGHTVLIIKNIFHFQVRYCIQSCIQLCIQSYTKVKNLFLPCQLTYLLSPFNCIQHLALVR